jgi:hypothetical protein
MKTKQRPTLSFWQIWNMSFGFLGIQYGFGLQQANLSPIFRYLGAEEATRGRGLRRSRPRLAEREHARQNFLA